MPRTSRRSYCGAPEHRLNRRAFLGAATGALVGGTAGLNMLGSPLFADQLQSERKRALLIFLAGGASQFETWDPKPGRPTGGPFQTIQTSIPGYHVCELLPEMARRLQRHTSVIRSIDTTNTDHDSGARLVLRGLRQENEGVKYPTLGAMLARELAQPGSTVPEHVALFTAYVGLTSNVQPDSAGFLGSRYDPINILSRLSPEGTRLPDFLSDREHKERGELRDLLSKQFIKGRERDDTLLSHTAAYTRVRGLMANEKLFDISQEPDRVRARYGPTLFGQQALVARRLLEAGVPFVRLNRGWWDSHGENFDIHAEMVPELDQVVSVLLDDLAERGLLRSTLVIMFSEMGRTPQINTMRGRDHFPRMSAALTGCGIRPGVVYGKTNADGTDIAEGRVTVPQFFATIFEALGIDADKEHMTPEGRPVALTNPGTKPIKALLA
jgi:hypothetical protein